MVALLSSITMAQYGGSHPLYPQPHQPHHHQKQCAPTYITQTEYSTIYQPQYKTVTSTQYKTVATPVYHTVTYTEPCHQKQPSYHPRQPSGYGK